MMKQAVSILQREPGNKDDGLRIIAVHVKNRCLYDARNLGTVK